MDAPATSPAATDRVTIGELATCSAVAVKAIRYDKDEGLLRAVERSPAGYRLFAAGHLRPLRLIRAMRSLGLSLAEVCPDVDRPRPCGHTQGPHPPGLVRHRRQHRDWPDRRSRRA